MLKTSTIAVAVIAAIALGGGRAEAQRGVDSELFRPALDSYGIFTVDRAQTSHQWDFGFKLYLNYAQNPLRFAMCNPTMASCAIAMTQLPKLSPVMGYQVAMNLGMHLGLTDWLELVVDVPVSAQSYTAVYGAYGAFGDPSIARTGFYANQGFTNVPPPDAAPLDWRIGFKARLLRRGVFGLALAAVVSLPFGDDASFLGDTNFTFQPKLIADITKGAVTAAINIGAVIRQETIILAPNDAMFGGMGNRSLIDLSHELTFSAGVAYRFVNWAGVAGEVYGYIPLVQSSNGPLDAPKDSTVDVLGGFQFFPMKDIAIALGAGANVTSTALRHDDFRVFAGITWAPAEGIKGAVSAGGVDSDGDGIPDAQDLCPNEPEDKDGFDDEDGCPDPDNDQDGIPDKLDKCPNEPEDKDGFQDEDGCPDLDNDGDGIPDATDKCPNEPETFNGVDDQDGCPDSGGQVQIAGGKIELPENILFETGQAKLVGRSEALLDHVAEKMKSNPNVKRVRIEGHTDDVGSPKKNQDLSQARAESVRDYLIKKGVEPDRLQAVGYGDTRPLDKGHSSAARAKNRRVEFIIVEQ